MLRTTFKTLAVGVLQQRQFLITGSLAAASIEGPRMFSTVFDKLGGAANVRVAVEKFYEKILADPVTAPFFQNIDMKKQKAKQINFMTLAFGGPNDYKGRSMYEAHKGMGLEDKHFDAVAGHFISTLRDLGVSEELIAEAAGVVESTRPQVLGKVQG